MATAKSVILDKYSRRILSSDEIVELLLCKNTLRGVLTDDDEERALYNKWSEQVLGDELTLESGELDISVEQFHENNINTWLIPHEYLEMDVKAYLLAKCTSEIEINRVITEYNMFVERGITRLLGLFIYLVDVMKENDVIWGVGRGSSVSCYCLYLIGVHRIDSIEYDLDISEFLK